MNELFASVMCFMVGLIIGYQQKQIFDLAHKIADKPKPRTGVTNPYKQPNQNAPLAPRPKDQTSGIVVPKSPQRLKWEQQERIRKESRDWGITPPKQGL